MSGPSLVAPLFLNPPILSAIVSGPCEQPVRVLVYLNTWFQVSGDAKFAKVGASRKVAKRNRWMSIERADSICRKSGEHYLRLSNWGSAVI